jgi:hypothetical protein
MAREGVQECICKAAWALILEGGGSGIRWDDDYSVLGELGGGGGREGAQGKSCIHTLLHTL